MQTGVQAISGFWGIHNLNIGVVWEDGSFPVIRRTMLPHRSITNLQAGVEEKAQTKCLDSRRQVQGRYHDEKRDKINQGSAKGIDRAGSELIDNVEV